MTATAATAPIEGDLIARREGAVGVIRLNRPKAINAVTLEMFRDVDKALDAFEADPAVAVILLEGAGERGLCAGGDIRALWESSKVKGDLGKILWREEYILNARIAKNNSFVFITTSLLLLSALITAVVLSMKP